MLERSEKEILILKQALKSAETIFLNPTVTYQYEDIIRGVQVNSTRKKAVDINTTQAFGKKLDHGNFWENKVKAMEVCDEYFLAQKAHILKALCSTIKSREALDAFEHELYKGLQTALLPYSTSNLINESYNRTRKIVELYLEHIVSMATEISDDHRKDIVPLLFLPIDSWIMAKEFIFDDYNLARWGLKRNSSFGSIRSKALFDDMQRYLMKKAQEISTIIGVDFHVIYFDVFWNNRLDIPGCNLFGEMGSSNQANSKLYSEKPTPINNVNNRVSNLAPIKTKKQSTAYPQLLSAIINELAASGIHVDKDYKCIKRKNGEYILEAIYPRRRKNIVTVWPSFQGGSIRIVGIGKYAEKLRFDNSDIGTDIFRADLRMAYFRTQ